MIHLPLLLLATLAHAEESPYSMPLERVTREATSGLDVDGNEASVLAREQARRFLEFKRGKLDQAEQDQWRARCLVDRESDGFCPLILGSEWAEKETLEADETEESEGIEAPLVTPQVQELIRSADVEGLRRATQGHVYRALRRFDQWKPLENLARKVIEGKPETVCRNTALAVALGQKAEQFFPKPEFKETAKALYQRTIACGSGEGLDRARFRLALLNVWEGKCADATPLFKSLAADPTGEFASRGLYWQARCAEREGRRLDAQGIEQKLMKQFPLTYHGLLLNSGNRARVSRLLGIHEPTVKVRSDLSVSANSWIRAIEGLVAVGGQEHAQRLFAKVYDVLLTTEPEFRLYVGMLMDRAGDRIGQFRMLTSVFRDDPGLISQSTLKLFYPLRRYEFVKRYGEAVGDPMLIAALIRQESGFNEYARSRVGAAGLMQLMPATARRMERVSRQALFNPATNIRLGVRYFDTLLRRFGRDAELSLAAYNAGPERVDEWRSRYPTDDRVLFLDLIPFKETREYVALISRNYYWYRRLYPVDEDRGPERRIAATEQSKGARMLFPAWTSRN